MQDETRKNDEFLSVPYVVYESAQTRMERTNKRLTFALILAVLLIFATNTGWLIYESQFETVEEGEKIQIEADEGNANFIGNNGDINNGGTNNGYTMEANPDKAEQ